MSRSRKLELYRTAIILAIPLLLCVAPAMSPAQDDAAEVAPHDKPKPKKKDAGPRALALLEIASSGRGTVIPIAILVDGKFYDASAYKASPVPMALEPGTIYEGMRAGEPLGLLTISNALHSDAINTKTRWLAKGVWLAEGATVVKTTRKAETTPVGLESKDEPPRLSKTPANPAAANSPTAPEPPRPQPVPQTSPTPAASGPGNASAKSGETDAKQSATGENAFRLRRGKPTQPIPEEKDEPRGVLQTMLAVSDEGEREAASFRYAWDKTEQAMREKQIEKLAQEALHAYMQGHAGPGAAAAKPAVKSPRVKKQATKPEETPFEKIALVALDVWRGNQPVLVYSAEAVMPQAQSANQRPDESTAARYFVTIVARSDIYGNLKQLYAGITDKQHFDVTPRMEFLDAVDADDDGRGELVFRENTGSATGFVIYKPGGDSLWKMYDSLNLQ